MTQQTLFEQVLGALLEDGHDVHFKKLDGIIFIILNDDAGNIVSGVTLEQIGQLMIGSAVSQTWKRIDGGVP